MTSTWVTIVLKIQPCLADSRQGQLAPAFGSTRPIPAILPYHTLAAREDRNGQVGFRTKAVI